MQSRQIQVLARDWLLLLLAVCLLATLVAPTQGKLQKLYSFELSFIDGDTDIDADNDGKNIAVDTRAPLPALAARTPYLPSDVDVAFISGSNRLPLARAPPLS